jgi:hypothetical protein
MSLAGPRLDRGRVARDEANARGAVVTLDVDRNRVARGGRPALVTLATVGVLLAGRETEGPLEALPTRVGPNDLTRRIELHPEADTDGAIGTGVRVAAEHRAVAVGLARVAKSIALSGAVLRRDAVVANLRSTTEGEHPRRDDPDDSTELHCRNPSPFARPRKREPAGLALPYVT